ncbi:carbamoyl-phosphate synthase large subunit [Clostridium tetanomorphum]|uniref:Carbamoyl phosphate synthase large chain n=1 Tax=Clostridium tetanomorphum TaxID=1553 RepID=A0A923EB83_CLOTT|nr:carbamoyl-phosphate synthase large subunit [Clostridium tetanomorphum]KAJ53555.1 carbamoyl phosphate synthase large subunit [Clostridium tetanomorphum DSM 665]MBC2398071.1 carbamoyl-phosphate synthase large subunit [Clostridium tetanomorphum]MBP1864638.1 carbamoyl-phosphate synthase large subunit [Clostridium tetanomorphum]NRS84108.1 carbamoyl-phosphate synthase large subunit [Clostridium tetanomorphum]NRZ97321.1 carbamoyl-phosphate synthase large subunit [Clostridium tetanomorphum]
MPLNKDIKKVLVIGSGPIVIGQAAEFDYSGTQACEALKEEGVEVVLINSNPATIMTDREVADKVYLEPLTVEFVEKVIAKERPDSLLAGMGGQTGLNLAVELYDKKILQKYGVNVIGTSIESIKEGEDRELFRSMMNRIGEPVIESEIITDMEAGKAFANKIGYPVIVRPAYTLGGTGGGIAKDEEELETILSLGLQLSTIGQVLLEKSVKGWKEIEYEVMRDSFGNCITVCNMENIDPVGIHTGDSIVVAPSQTLSDKEYQMLRTASINIINAVGIEGGCNVQFALNPNSFEYAVIEINPRVSRSSALASKATGYPIAKVAAKIALGYGLDEIKNAVTQKTYACFEPSLDYVVVKIPKWPFDKFQEADRVLGTKMMATGEVMAIGSNFEAAFLKGIRSLETGKYSLEHKKIKDLTISELKKRVMSPDDERIFALAEMLRREYREEKVAQITGIDKFFIKKFKKIVEEEQKLRGSSVDDLDKEWLYNLKKKGFSDKAIGDMLNVSPENIYRLRSIWNIKPVYKMVDTCGGEFEALSPYYYSTYESYDEVEVSDKRKVIVIGSGPIRIGQGIEFDYASVHCVKALKNMGIETIIINNNPETVSTDFDISDKLYFEPLTEEDVLNIIEKENPYGVILQFGGQTAIKLAKFLKEKNIKTLGTTSDQIDTAEDREKFDELLENLGIARPKGKGVWSIEEGLKEAEKLGFPVLVRPSFVLGGQGMEITHDEKELVYYLTQAFEKDKKNPILIDKYLMGREIEVDAISDGEDILIPGIMEHLERAGVHSGDSITMYPGPNLTKEIKEKVLQYTKKLALGIGIKGMINIQFIEFKGQLYVIEVNPRASRTVPYISKVSKVPIVDIATKVMLGEKLKNLGYGVDIYKEPELISVKVPVFSTQKLPNVEVCLGPEMRSTGEVLGVGKTIEEALYKGFLAANMYTKKEKGVILATINDHDKEEFLPIAKELSKLGFKFMATAKTAKLLKNEGIEVKEVRKLKEEHPNIIDVVKNGEVDLVINTPTKGNDSKRDGFHIRRAAIERNIGVITALDTFKAMVEVKSKCIKEEELRVYDLGK